ncbi:high-affinity choline transporter 1-like [Amblyomma americanum]
MAVVVRAAVWLVGAVATVMALSVRSVYALWSLSADLVYVVLFPQLLCLFYLQEFTNTYGLVSGVVMGVVVRALCGEPSMSLPARIKLPMYDDQTGQKFPHRTLCMALNLITTVATSPLWEKLFTQGFLPRSLECCRCFAEPAELPNRSHAPSRTPSGLGGEHGLSMQPTPQSKHKEAASEDGPAATKGAVEVSASHESKASRRSSRVSLTSASMWDPLKTAAGSPSSKSASSKTEDARSARDAPAFVIYSTVPNVDQSVAGNVDAQADDRPQKAPKAKVKRSRSKVIKPPKRTL